MFLDQFTSAQRCRGVAFALAIVIGLLVVFAARYQFGVSILVAVLMGAAVALGGMWLLPRLLCSAHASERAVAEPVRPAPAGAPAPTPKAEPAPKPATPAAVSAQDVPAAAGKAPELLAAPRGGKGDDLKKIKGVGPKLEQELNARGVWHYDQIAAWSAEEVAWADVNLVKFKGRVSRDDWVGQAKILAAGGETEFSRRSGGDGA